MGISSLPIQSIKRLKEVVADIEDILVRRDTLMEDADALKERRDKAIELQYKLDSKALEFSKLSTSIDAKELRETLDKLEEVSTEIERINSDYKIVYKQIVDLSKAKDELSREYDEIKQESEEKNEKIVNKWYLDKLNINASITGISIPESIFNILNMDNNIIISCEKNKYNEIAEPYIKNKDKFAISNDEFDFDKFNEEINEYKKEKNDSLDKMLEFVTKTDEVKQEENTSIGNQESEIVLKTDIEQPIKEEIINSSEEQNIQENAANINQKEIIMDKPTENVEIGNTIEEKPKLQTPSVDSIVSFDTETSNSALDKQIEEMGSTVEKQDNNIISIDELINNVKELYIDNIDKKNTLNKMTRATKDKKNNKIVNILDGSYPKTIIKPLQNKKEVNNDEVIDIDNFLNNKAA